MKYSAVLWLLELQIVGGGESKGLDAGKYRK